MAAGARVGTVIDNKYRLDEQIGHGGMGAVYRGTQLMVDRPVAVKLLHPNFAQQQSVQARFEVEARAIGRLNHPNCITLYDFGYSEDLNALYTVVEFIDGTALDQLVHQRLELAEVVSILKQIASALDHAHHHGILHRDLKPENIMLARQTDGSRAVKVLDFGIAQIVTGESSDEDDFEADRLTRAGELFGTPPYMSPEQAQSSRNLTPATDLYSLGVIGYELLENRLPFFADTPLDILMMHIHQDPPPLRRPGLPAELRQVIADLLAKDPTARPSSGKVVHDRLAQISHKELQVPLAGVSPSEGSATREQEPTLLNIDESDPSLNIPLDLPSPHTSSIVEAPGDARPTTIPTMLGAHEPAPRHLPPPTDAGPYPRAQTDRHRGRVLGLALVLVAMFASLLWWVGAKTDANTPAAAPQDSPAAASSTPEPPPMPPRSLPTADGPAPREVSVAEPETPTPEAPTDLQDAAAPEFPPPPPPTRPATQRRAESDSSKPSRPRSTRRTASSKSTTEEDAPVRLHYDEQNENAPRRPARLGL
ncbi:serine/threonine-protein kinase [Lujinxingia litoralis]|nr:serine/threonine-protein kinase [Lujinxingia litoralis]